MKSLPAPVAVVVTASILLAGLWLLATSRLEYCGPSPVPTSHVDTASSLPSPTPTLAPPRKVVIVRVETDKPDLQVGWAENWLPYRQLTNQ